MGRLVRRGFIIATVFLALVVVYENYKIFKREAARSPASEKINPEFLRSLIESPLEDKVAICEMAQSYICNQIILKPNAIYTQFSYNTCAEITLMSSGDEEKKLYCLDVLVHQNNSVGEKESEEFICFNHIMGEKDQNLTKSVSRSLAEALGHSVYLCKQLIEY